MMTSSAQVLGYTSWANESIYMNLIGIHSLHPYAKYKKIIGTVFKIINKVSIWWWTQILFGPRSKSILSHTQLRFSPWPNVILSWTQMLFCPEANSDSVLAPNAIKSWVQIPFVSWSNMFSVSTTKLFSFIILLGLHCSIILWTVSIIECARFNTL